MSSRTFIRTATPNAHVPVDKFTIVNGPSAARCIQIREELQPMFQIRDTRRQMIRNVQGVRYLNQTFTLTTPASDSGFRRHLRLACLWDVQLDDSFSFTALFHGQIVSGIYFPATRSGWFSFD